MSPTKSRSGTRDSGLRTRLERERAELIAAVSAHDASNAEEQITATSGRGETEHVALDELHGVSAVVDSMARSALAGIDAALARLDEGTYGLCVDCGERIPSARLEAMPAAERCVVCQQATEAGLR